MRIARTTDVRHCCMFTTCFTLWWYTYTGIECQSGNCGATNTRHHRGCARLRQNPMRLKFPFGSSRGFETTYNAKDTRFGSHTIDRCETALKSIRLHDYTRALRDHTTVTTLELSLSSVMATATLGASRPKRKDPPFLLPRNTIGMEPPWIRFRSD